jgi:hypothetical protein
MSAFAAKWPFVRDTGWKCILMALDVIEIRSGSEVDGDSQ